MANNYSFPLKESQIAELQARADAEVAEQEEPEHSMIRNVRRRLGDETLQLIVQRYEAGETSITLMAEYGVGKSTMLRLLRQRGAAIRRQPINSEQATRAAALYEAGQSLTYLVKELGLPRETIRRGLLASGVQMRSRGSSSTAALAESVGAL